jgi:hypothetical protein
MTSIGGRIAFAGCGALPEEWLVALLQTTGFVRLRAHLTEGPRCHDKL